VVSEVGTIPLFFRIWHLLWQIQIICLRFVGATFNYVFCFCHVIASFIMLKIMQWILSSRWYNSLSRFCTNGALNQHFPVIILLITVSTDHLLSPYDHICRNYNWCRLLLLSVYSYPSTGWSLAVAHAWEYEIIINSVSL
jgi:hypothetical protein